MVLSHNRVKKEKTEEKHESGCFCRGLTAFNRLRKFALNYFFSFEITISKIWTMKKTFLKFADTYGISKPASGKTRFCFYFGNANFRT